MKKRIVLIILPVLFVFVVCFFIGRAVVIKDGENQNDDIKETTDEIKTEAPEIAPASSGADKVEKKLPKEAAKVEIEPKTENKSEPPERMLFPCGQNILKDYSQTAVYSKTMDDWRAHTGVDYKADLNSDVVSAWNGVVLDVYKDLLWGNTVIIEHNGGLKTIYKNLNDNILIRKGQAVKAGQVIGKVGDSAAVENREEAHLHFEIHSDDVPINPTSYIY